MEAGLFDVLTGEFVDGRPIPAVGEGEHRLLSIMGNLQRLFNTRQGSIHHMPEYGLPDISSLYREMSLSIDELRQSIRLSVQRYEPRLAGVKVEFHRTDSVSRHLVFIVSGDMGSGRRVRFETTFASHDLAQVKPWYRTD